MMVHVEEEDFIVSNQINKMDERNCRNPMTELEENVPTDTIDQNNGGYCRHFIPLIPRDIPPENCPFFFFDLDNTLYPKSSGIAELMVQRIELFFVNYLKLPMAESRQLGARFYKDYGLAIKGLIKHFSIDPVEYDKYVDGGLPLEDILTPQNNLTALMERLSKKGSCWVFTNAGKSHAIRVLKLLQIDHFFSGIIYCDYSEADFPAKPDRLAFTRAMKCANVNDPKRCHFFDDSIGNIQTAQEIGWNVVYIDEDANLKLNHSSSVGEINAQMEIITNDPQEEGQETMKIFPTINFIEDVESVLKLNKQFI